MSMVKLELFLLLLTVSIFFGICASALFQYIWAIKLCFRRNFNKFDNWNIDHTGILPFWNWKTFSLKNHMRTIVLSVSQKLPTDEKILAYVDFDFFPVLWKESKFHRKFIFLTNKHIVLIRLSLWMTEMQYKLIPFFEIKNIIVSSNLHTFFVKYIRVSLHNEEIYQFIPNKRLLSRKFLDYHKTIIDFFEHYAQSKRKT